ncbi:MAG: hypothetical protein PHE06_05595 [Lachnospiraceae bacterium]|nr:hypothetical protein [Lachnospiraceae bacterium]
MDAGTDDGIDDGCAHGTAVSEKRKIKGNGSDKMNQTPYEIIKEKIDEAEFVLIGIGEEFSLENQTEEQLQRAYECLNTLIAGKTYFIVTMNSDEVIFRSKLLGFFIAAPFTDEKRQQSSQEQWNAYLSWLSATLGHRLCILELGVGFANPQVIRWPFEKTAVFNQKSSFVRVNQKFPQLSEELAGKGISIAENAVRVFTD